MLSLWQASRRNSSWSREESDLRMISKIFSRIWSFSCGEGGEGCGQKFLMAKVMGDRALGN